MKPALAPFLDSFGTVLRYSVLDLFLLHKRRQDSLVNRIIYSKKESCLESELVSGYNTDYSGIIFVFFFLAEYSNIILISALTTIFFFVGFHLSVIFEQYTFINFQSVILALKTCVFCFAFV